LVQPAFIPNSALKGTSWQLINPVLARIQSIIDSFLLLQIQSNWHRH